MQLNILPSTQSVQAGFKFFFCEINVFTKIEPIAIKFPSWDAKLD